MEILKLFDHTTNTWKSVPAIKGEDGNPGVYYGTSTPPAGMKVWIDPSGTVSMAGLILELTHPVGSLYWSEDSTDPGTIFGGTWSRIKDKFILAAGDTYAVGATGGEATHTLTKAELPAERLKVQYADGRTFYWTTVSSSGSVGGMSINSGNGILTEAMGSGQAHNNMPPYEAYYCWKRIA